MFEQGVCQNGKCIAVKKLDQLKATVQKPQFENEVYHLMRLKHPNIVRFVGYCYETRNECVFHDGKYVFAEMPQKLVCLEYLPNRSLDRHVSGI
jgi:serine/threonine protein kinase